MKYHWLRPYVSLQPPPRQSHLRRSLDTHSTRYLLPALQRPILEDPWLHLLNPTQLKLMMNEKKTITRKRRTSYHLQFLPRLCVDPLRCIRVSQPTESDYKHVSDAVKWTMWRMLKFVSKVGWFGP